MRLEDMPRVDVVFVGDGDGCWPDLAGKELIEPAQGIINLAGLAGGMVSGKPSVGIRVNLPDGRVVIAQTSLRLFLTCADALKARYGDPRD